MWRHLPALRETPGPAALPETPRTPALRETPRPPALREKRRLVKGLRSVSRRGATAGRARRYEVLLCNRAAAVRSDLLEVAATLERVPNPDPSTLKTLRWLLTDGCTSPLYHPDVPMADLVAALELVQAELDGLDPCGNTLKCQIANRP